MRFARIWRLPLAYQGRTRPGSLTVPVPRALASHRQLGHTVSSMAPRSPTTGPICEMERSWRRSIEQRLAAIRVGILACGRGHSQMAQSPRTTVTTGHRPQRSRARLGTRRQPTKPGRNSPTWPAPQPITSSISTASSNADCGSARISLKPPALERSRAGVACIDTVGGVERATRAGEARASGKSRRLPRIARGYS